MGQEIDVRVKLGRKDGWTPSAVDRLAALENPVLAEEVRLYDEARKLEAATATIMREVLAKAKGNVLADAEARAEAKVGALKRLFEKLRDR
jgi:hypothetical protein